MSNYVMEQESQCLFLGKTCEIFKIQHDVDMKLTYLHLASFQECTLKSSCENEAIKKYYC